MHRCRRVSDRVSVLQFTTEDKIYECVPTDGINLKIQLKKIYKMKPQTETKLTLSTVKVKKCISITNVHAPTTERVRNDPSELDQLYAEIGETMSKLKRDTTTKTSLLLLAEDFNAKVVKTQGESCLGSYSRARRNASGQMLVDFCNIQNLFICNGKAYDDMGTN